MCAIKYNLTYIFVIFYLIHSTLKKPKKKYLFTNTNVIVSYNIIIDI